MTLFTGRGDDGTTYTKNSKDRFSKDSKLTEALGTVDELNSYIGIVKTHLGDSQIDDTQTKELIEEIQQNLFIVQAELAGARISISEKKTREISQKIIQIEEKIPPVTSFIIAGGSEIAAEFDFARTIARRAERRVVARLSEKPTAIKKGTLAYLNRLSSMLYALARLYNYKFGIKEKGPNYQ